MDALWNSSVMRWLTDRVLLFGYRLRTSVAPRGVSGNSEGCIPSAVTPPAVAGRMVISHVSPREGQVSGLAPASGAATQHVKVFRAGSSAATRQTPIAAAPARLAASPAKTALTHRQPRRTSPPRRPQ